MKPSWAAVEDHPNDCGVYVHFPYCLQKCPYCDFNSHAQKLGTPNLSYTEAVLSELHTRLQELDGLRLRSIFFGGGTPSMWDADSIQQVIQTIRDHFPGHPPLEITLEANPGTVERGRLDMFKAAGINRVSMGVQALDTALLRTLGRVHDAEEALDALDVIQRVGFESHSIDLMFGIPGQTPAAWQSALDRIIGLGTPHVSAYNLIYEPGTKMRALRDKGQLVALDEDVEADMFGATVETFKGAGFHHYEVSNYCQPGHSSIHNQLYWRGCYYLGVGAGAHSFTRIDLLHARRTENVRLPEAYTASCTAGAVAFSLDETVGAAERRDEAIMLGLRTARGWRTENAGDALVAAEMASSYPTWCNFVPPFLKPTELGLLMSDALILKSVTASGRAVT